MSKIFDKTTDALSTAVNMRLMKNNVISANIANAETPGYKAKKMDFEEALARQVDIDGLRKMSTSHLEHIPVGGSISARARHEIYYNPDGVTSNDGNTVDLEKEMTLLAENQIQYKAAIQLINKKLAALKYAASEGR